MPGKYNMKRENGNACQESAFSPMFTIFSSLLKLMLTFKLNITLKRVAARKKTSKFSRGSRPLILIIYLFNEKCDWLTSVNSTLAGSPITVPSGCAYPAYLISWEFHTRKSLFGSFLCGKTVMTDLKFPPLVANSKCFLRTSNISLGVVTLRASNTWLRKVL